MKAQGKNLFVINLNNNDAIVRKDGIIYNYVRIF